MKNSIIYYKKENKLKINNGIKSILRDSYYKLLRISVGSERFDIQYGFTFGNNDDIESVKNYPSNISVDPIKLHENFHKLTLDEKISSIAVYLYCEFMGGDTNYFVDYFYGEPFPKQIGYEGPSIRYSVPEVVIED